MHVVIEHIFVDRVQPILKKYSQRKRKKKETIT